ncbi:3'-5' exonuclease, partial [Clostridium novyi]|uniref:3'-5' exonuclease n=1 Tax=Clostridium novyi TaxID=1542 RepID=UPI0004D93F57
DTLTLDILEQVMSKNTKKFSLNLTYRLPYAVAVFSGYIIDTDIEKRCVNKQDKKYLPSVIRCNDVNQQIDFIVREIYNKDLKDVGILVHNNKSVEEVLEIVKQKVNEIYQSDEKRKKPIISYKINDDEHLNFREKNSITIMVFHSSKGTQFENVFIPKCDKESIYSSEQNYDKALFVACTRTSKNLYILYDSKIGLTKLIEKIDKTTYNRYKYSFGKITREI